MLPPAVLWIDPGLMTGFARLESGIYFSADEREFMDAGHLIVGITAYYGASLAIGWERFTIFEDTHKLTPQPEAAEIIGLARYHATANRCRILPDAAPGERKPATMAMLRKIGWWVPGKDDAQSAAQHMLAWLLRTDEVPPQQRAILNQALQGEDDHAKQRRT